MTCIFTEHRIQTHNLRITSCVLVLRYTMDSYIKKKKKNGNKRENITLPCACTLTWFCEADGASRFEVIWDIVSLGYLGNEISCWLSSSWVLDTSFLGSSTYLPAGSSTSFPAGSFTSFPAGSSCSINLGLVDKQPILSSNGFSQIYIWGCQLCNSYRFNQILYVQLYYLLQFSWIPVCSGRLIPIRSIKLIPIFPVKLIPIISRKIDSNMFSQINSNIFNQINSNMFRQINSNRFSWFL